jgi:hypothetical protein
MRPSGQSVSVTNSWALSWDDWLKALPDDRRLRAQTLREAFRDRDADDPESWTRSEVDEDIPQLGRFLFLSATWRRMHWAVSSALDSQGANELRASGCDMTSVEAVVRSALYDLAFNLCYLVDEPGGISWTDEGPQSTDVGPTDPRWKLVEVTADGDATGRDLLGLHESLLETDPEHNEGQGWL